MSSLPSPSSPSSSSSSSSISSRRIIESFVASLHDYNPLFLDDIWHHRSAESRRLFCTDKIEFFIFLRLSSYIYIYVHICIIILSIENLSQLLEACLKLLKFVKHPILLRRDTHFIFFDRFNRINETIVVTTLILIPVSETEREPYEHVYFTYLSSQYFDDEAREIRARVDSLLRRVHIFVPRAVARYI